MDYCTNLSLRLYHSFCIYNPLDIFLCILCHALIIKIIKTFTEYLPVSQQIKFIYYRRFAAN